MRQDQLYKSFCTLLMTLMGLSCLHAQQDLLTESENFCKPGVCQKSPSKGLLISYSNLSEQSWNYGYDGDNIFNMTGEREQFRFKMKIPLLLKPRTKMLAGIDHIRETYDFDKPEQQMDPVIALQGNTLKASRLSFYFTHALNDRMYLGLKGEGTFNGNYDKLINFSQEYAIYRGVVTVGIKPNDNTEWILGALYTHGFHRKRVLPLVVYNKTFSDKWGLETVIPVMTKLRYNHSPKDVFTFNNLFQSRNYAVNFINGQHSVVSSVSPVEQYWYQHSSIRSSMTWNRQLAPWTWLEIQGGLDIPVGDRLERLTGIPDTPALSLSRTKLAPFFQIGVFLSPSKYK